MATPTSALAEGRSTPGASLAPELLCSLRFAFRVQAPAPLSGVKRLPYLPQLTFTGLASKLQVE